MPLESEHAIFYAFYSLYYTPERQPSTGSTSPKIAALSVTYSPMYKQMPSFNLYSNGSGVIITV